MARILFVEDEEDLLSSLVAFFTREGFEVFHARGGDAAIQLAARMRPDIAVLDVMLHEGPEGPNGKDGFEVLRALRDRDFHGPVIFLTARTLETDKLLAFDLGADDYITKPFSLLELRARVRAALKRAGGGKAVYRYGKVEVDLDNYVIRHDDELERLSNREQELLRYLIEHRGKVLQRDELLTSIWKYSAGVTTRTVDTHILNVRKKLRDDASEPAFIETLHGIGYKFIAKEH
ncbi:DNA-binding response regulator [Deltaproteobacteria bacterium]|nr:DNA-binding response regulator [Deltaproteobacteria bacterium]